MKELGKSVVDISNTNNPEIQIDNIVKEKSIDSELKITGTE